jgi:hypothetical protein
MVNKTRRPVGDTAKIENNFQEFLVTVDPADILKWTAALVYI